MSQASGMGMDALARRLLAFEEQGASPPDAAALGVERTVARTYEALEPLIGPVGFLALLRRAVHLSRAAAPWLEGLELQVGQVVALAGLHAQARMQGAAVTREGGALLVAHLLELLCVFLGEDLTLRRLQRAWPELLGRDARSEGGGGSP